MSPRLQRRPVERRGLNLWPVGPVLALAFAVALLVAGGVFYTAWELLGARGLKPEHRLDSSTLFDLVKLSFGVVAGAGALVALIVAYRRQRVDEDGALRDATRLHTERFTTAVSQLGDNAPAVQLGGVHALAGLADDAPTRALRQTCIDVLCAYLQLPHTPDPGTDNPAVQEEHHRYLALRTVRHTVLRLIGDHYRLPVGTHGSWQGCNLDLSGITIDATIDFSGATFSEGLVNFHRATFSSGAVGFAGATFSGGELRFDDATFSGNHMVFINATFSGKNVYFGNSTFSGSTMYFDGATFSGGTVRFDRATFSGGDLRFTDTRFSGGNVSFGSATFSGSDVGFGGATFSSNTVHFDRATFSGGDVNFAGALGDAPSGLVPGAGESLPPGLALPNTWMP
ncbi:pentapeptide repeat-containing protein [Streptomyces sp. NBC_01462]|uniref:pentapeptide repeat-containing protein n=1 Tax=Streptomyces sp. NBC_01462 TaxID=2903876 RepID=UPI002E2F76D4|nr:pentapeptide repeat-containing protein [Streptomyces sp. NBC_01462]